MANIYIALVHYPVLNKNNETIVTSVTNLDIHDISRSAFTYGIKNFFIITPDPEQHKIVQRVTDFWETNSGLMYNPMRVEALSIVKLCTSIDETINAITTQEGIRPLLVTTTAREMQKQISFRCLGTFSKQAQPILILFGTGYGLIDEVHSCADYILAPIKGKVSYNHLSVRSAVAIVLDRVTSENIYGRNNGYSANSWQRPNQNRLSRLSRRRYREGPL
ncbi:MAG: hypothetical protein CVU48_04270 [Candidatus Cloacimonetes bacterium HGW-Cloacimonetes-1]|nr:MAG: hypothetical protein CVU48_04270 [Candidatus Cloacimonetes bacterium HGW-Cloacimonetes-1]